MATDTKTRMIEATARLIQARGYRGVSLSDILSESAAPRGSLYFHFPGGKESLVLEAMQIGIDEATQVLRECLDQSDDPANGIRAFFEAAAQEMADSDYAFGCPVAPIVLDTPGLESELAKACQAALRQWSQMYRDKLMTSGLAEPRARRLADTIVASLEGVLIMARSERDAECIRQVGDEMTALIASVLAE
jgi:TetR/AcrR family transcriptional regulator, lmrAB and yxaGH operons repressor